LIVNVIIPAYNEEESIGLVISDIPKKLVSEIIVCNNNSTDNTVELAQKAGATVVDQPRKGYGSACLKGMEYIANKPTEEQPDVVVFLDGDYSDHPEEMEGMLKEIEENEMDLVIGSRALGSMETGAMMPQQLFGNWLATTLLKFFYNYQFTDLGPFRAIKWEVLKNLGMEDPDFGWTVEMQARAAKAKLKCKEIPVSYRKRIGVSKISGTLKGTVLAGHKILWTIFKLL